MKQFAIYIFLSLIHCCLSPHFACPKDRPFLISDSKCGNFSDTCFKSGSDECDFAIRACKQCPLSNFSSAILDRVLKTMYNPEDKNCTPTKIESKPIKECPTSPLLWIILIVLLILTILITVYLVKQKKCLQGRNPRSRINGQDPESTPLQNVHPVDLVDNPSYPPPNISISEDRITKILQNQVDSINRKLQEVAENQVDSINRKLQEVAENQINPINRKLQDVAEVIGVGTWFRIPQFDKSLKIIVHENDNIVSIKRKICANLVNIKTANDLKMMQLQYNGRVLDDNQYLQKIIGLESNPILCIMNEELKACTILLQLRGNIYVPEMIQLEKCVHISQLKEIVNKENIDPESLFIIKGSEILELNKTIEECDLVDNDIIKVIKREKRTVNVKQIFKDYAKHKDPTLHICNIEKVAEIKSEILKKLDINPELKDIFLFYESNYLNDDMFYFEFDSGKTDEMSYCNLVKASFLLKDQEPELIGTGDHNEIYECFDWSKRKIILKKSNSDIKENKSLINELMMFNETKNHSGFVQLLGIFRGDTSFYVAVENMSDNSISDFIKTRFPISESMIIKWSQQILEGLEFLHSRQIIHRNIKPSNILLNEEGNKAKISSFGLSKRLYGPKGTVEKLLFSKVEILRYMAPEMYVDMVYDFKSEVYSFGVTLTEIITGEIPYQDQLDDDNALEQIRNMGPLAFSSENKKLERIVKTCIQYKPEDRPFISDLLKEEPF